MNANLEASDAALRTPSLRRRMACWIYEGLLLFAVMFMAGYLFSTLSQTRHALDNRHGLQAFLFLIFGIYFTWFGHKGQTLAMKTWRIRLVDTSGKPLSQGRALWRYVLSWVWFLPPLIVISGLALSGGETLLLLLGWACVWAVLSRFQPEGQFWHDVWAGTRLIHSEPLSR
ncbi:COG1714 Predicted membrane protein/domain [Burkholderiaceae bacterium]